ncbi:monocarboxylate transporter [Mycena belliarum]|uniref:Monocarboxylate transporter n=1 Tax=Mycena belliarum TaxID=1033014 RepID=A0AAD6XFE7_9AGAR|nr:monocarboxylate transporter [Mycena belliae]
MGSTVVEIKSEDPQPTRRYQAVLLSLLLAGFMMMFHVIGVNSVFGIFQDLYTSDESKIPGTRGNDAVRHDLERWYICQLAANPIIACVESVKLVTLAGVVTMSLGLLLASYSSSLWQLFRTQALLYGVGGLVLAPVLQVLLGRYGVGPTLRILAGWNFAMGVPVACVVRRRSAFNRSAGREPTRINMALVKRGTFLYQSLGAFLQAAGNVIPLYYMTSYSISILAYSRSTGSLLLAINSAVNSVSRISMGLLADRVGRQNTMICGVFLSALCVLGLWYDAARPRFVTFVVMYGIYAGGYNALVPTTISEIYGVENYARVNGFVYFVRGLGSLFGAPVAGLILGSYKRGGAGEKPAHYRNIRVVVYDGVLLLCAGVCVAYVRWLDARDKGAWKWRA